MVLCQWRAARHLQWPHRSRLVRRLWLYPSEVQENENKPALVFVVCVLNCSAIHMLQFLKVFTAYALSHDKLQHSIYLFFYILWGFKCHKNVAAVSSEALSYFPNAHHQGTRRTSWPALPTTAVDCGTVRPVSEMRCLWNSATLVGFPVVSLSCVILGKQLALLNTNSAVRTCGFDFSGNIIMFSTDKQMGYQCFLNFFDLRDPQQIGMFFSLDYNAETKALGSCSG